MFIQPKIVTQSQYFINFGYRVSAAKCVPRRTILSIFLLVKPGELGKFKIQPRLQKHTAHTFFKLHINFWVQMIDQTQIFHWKVEYLFQHYPVRRCGRSKFSFFSKFNCRSRSSSPNLILVLNEGYDYPLPPD